VNERIWEIVTDDLVLLKNAVDRVLRDLESRDRG
jgi:hypothetical protein